MTYQETLDYLYTAAPAFEKVGAGAYKEGLSNTLALDEHFHHPHRQFKTIHVAGTNGKGSTSHTLAALLQCAGYRVGLYTSPHLVDFNERIKINGEPIPHQYVINFVESERSFFEPLYPSFFELTTALAFKYFAEQHVDIAVIEVGLGGRLDCTNIITPLLSIITNISFDHTGFLGDTLSLIAGEKAGIIKPNVPVVIGEYTAETRPVFEAKAAEMQAPIIFAQDNPMVTSDTLATFQLKGYCQERNLNTILNCLPPLAEAMQHAGMDTSRFMTGINNSSHYSNCVMEALSCVCSLTGLMGRWQTIQQTPLVVCDTGHNLAGWEYLAQQIADTGKDKTMRIVFGMVDDKDINGVLRLIPKGAKYYFTQADTHRAIKVEKLQNLAHEQGIEGVAYHTVQQAYQQALSDATPEDFIFVGGSSYVVADFLAQNLAPNGVE